MNAKSCTWAAQLSYFTVLAALAGFVQGAPPNGQENKLRLESSSGIATEVERTASGELKTADQQQASLSGSAPPARYSRGPTGNR